MIYRRCVMSKEVHFQLDELFKTICEHQQVDLFIEKGGCDSKRSFILCNNFAIFINSKYFELDEFDGKQYSYIKL